MIDTQASGYDAIRTGTAIIDWAGSLLLDIRGPGRAALLGALVTRDTDFLLEGQSLQALILDEDGRVISDVIVHGLEESTMISVWPSASTERVREIFLTRAAELGEVEVVDQSAEMSVIGIEGPGSFEVADPYLDFPVSSLAYRSGTPVEWRDTTIMISRNGVTGEFGYLFFVPAPVSAELHAELVERGAQEATREAVDICRMEMRFPNIDAESGDDGSNPFELGLQWMVDLDGASQGVQAAVRSSAGALRPVCWISDDETAPVPRRGAPVTVQEETLGEVTHAVWSPVLRRPIGTARLHPHWAAAGLELSIDAKPSRTVSAPFIITSSFTTPMA